MSRVLVLLNDYLTCHEAEELKAELEQTIPKTLQDHTFRLALGANDEYWKLAQQAIPELYKQHQDCLINLLKLCRNVVAGDSNNQNLAIEHDVLDKLDQIIQVENNNIILLQMSIQTMCNLVTNNPPVINRVWKEWVKSHRWSEILSNSNDGLITSVLVLIINCVRNNKQNCVELVQDGYSILNTILSDIERLHESEGSKNFELSYTIFSELFDFGLFSSTFKAVGDHSTMLLKLLDSKIHAFSGSSFSTFLTGDDISVLVQQLKVRSKQTVDILVNVKSASTTEKSELEVENVSDTYTAIVLSLQILNEILVRDTALTKNPLVQEDAMSLITDVLGHLQTTKLPADQKDPQAGFNYLKRECVRMMGSLCYKDRSMQDKIRAVGGIPLLLSQFKIDDTNPYLREYATVALGNVMEDNEENQALLAELKPIEAVQTDELAQLGLSPELLENGKVRINKTEL